MNKDLNLTPLIDVTVGALGAFMLLVVVLVQHQGSDTLGVETARADSSAAPRAARDEAPLHLLRLSASGGARLDDAPLATPAELSARLIAARPPAANDGSAHQSVNQPRAVVVQFDPHLRMDQLLPWLNAIDRAGAVARLAE